MQPLFHNPQPMKPELVFVYGSLQTGLGNNRVMGNSQFLGYARMIAADNSDSFTMRAYSPSFPAIYRDEKYNSKTWIDGQLFKIKCSQVMEAVDCLESNPHWYRREKQKVRLDNGHTTEAWVYVMQGEERGPIVKGGNWNQYRIKRGGNFYVT